MPLSKKYLCKTIHNPPNSQITPSTEIMVLQSALALEKADEICLVLPYTVRDLFL